MIDLNFFEPYIEKKEIKFSKQLVLLLSAFLIFLFFLVYSIYNQLQIYRLESIVNQLKAVAEDPKIVERVADIKLKEDDVNRFKTEVETIKDLNNAIERTDFIKEEFLKSITAKMPTEIFLTSYRVSTNEVNLSGVSKDKLSVAEFRKGLEKIDYIEDIFISNITRHEDNYQFTIVCTLEGVGLDDADTEQKE